MLVSSASQNLVKPPCVHVLAYSAAEFALHYFKRVGEVVHTVFRCPVSVFEMCAGIVLNYVYLISEGKGIMHFTLTDKSSRLAVFVYTGRGEEVDVLAVEKKIRSAVGACLQKLGATVSTVEGADERIGI